MVKRIIHIFLLSAAILCAVSCLEKEIMVQEPVNDAIVLRLPRTGTRTVESTHTESYVHHLDVFIFKADADNAKHLGGTLKHSVHVRHIVQGLDHQGAL